MSVTLYLPTPKTKTQIQRKRDAALRKARERPGSTSAGNVITSAGTMAVADNFSRNPYASYWRKSPWPNTQQLVFNFTDAVLLSANATPAFYGLEYLVKLNGMNQPTSISTGLPYGLATYRNLYNFYRVDSVEIDLAFYSTGSVDLFPSTVLQASSDVFVMTGKTIPVVLSYPGTYGQLLPTTGGQSLRVCQRIWPHEVEGITRQQYISDINRYSSGINGDPSTVPFMRFAVASFSTPSATCYALIKLAYHVTVFDRILSNTEP